MGLQTLPGLSNYIVVPKIVRCREMSVIRIVKGNPQAGFDRDAEYRARLYPTEELDTPEYHWKGPRLQVQLGDEELTIRASFSREQRYLIEVEKLRGEQVEPVGTFAIYALEADLYDRLPFKGDMHIHSNQSDGVEAPAYVAAMCRKIGLDFMALTDHGKYVPSLEAQQAFREVPVDLKIYPGEEVHPPGNPIHIVNFGGRFSVNELFRGEAYAPEVQALQAELGTPAGANPYWVASAAWCFNKIREAGGLGIFCHPYWFANQMVRIPESLTSAMFEMQPYDALELIGGYFKHEAWSNNWQVARYYEETAKGKRIPIVGVSDAHGCHKDLFGWYYTIVLARSSELEELVMSIKEGYSVAVEWMAGEVARVYGPFRLVKYAHFLLEEVFPGLDALCWEEGELMIACLNGEVDALERLGQRQGRTGQLRQAFCRGS